MSDLVTRWELLVRAKEHADNARRWLDGASEDPGRAALAEAEAHTSMAYTQLSREYNDRG